MNPDMSNTHRSPVDCSIWIRVGVGIMRTETKQSLAAYPSGRTTLAQYAGCQRPAPIAFWQKDVIFPRGILWSQAMRPPRTVQASPFETASYRRQSSRWRTH
jgi:hypothetical protein